jgi:hypothetical protein
VCNPEVTFRHWALYKSLLAALSKRNNAGANQSLGQWQLDDRKAIDKLGQA